MLLLTRSRLVSSLQGLNRARRSHAGASNPARAEEERLFGRLRDVVWHTWYLGFTSFGGPPVHFQIFHARFVEKEKWVDEQTVGRIHLNDLMRRLMGVVPRTLRHMSGSSRTWVNENVILLGFAPRGLYPGLACVLPLVVCIQSNI